MVIGVLALVPVAAGAAGILGGAAFLSGRAEGVDLDSHVRFLSGVFLMVGIAFWSCIPNLEATAGRFRLLAVLVVAGGLARALSLATSGVPSVPHLAGLGLELVVVPLLVVWHTRVTRLDRRSSRAAGSD